MTSSLIGTRLVAPKFGVFEMVAEAWYLMLTIFAARLPRGGLLDKRQRAPGRTGQT